MRISWLVVTASVLGLAACGKAPVPSAGSPATAAPSATTWTANASPSSAAPTPAPAEAPAQGAPGPAASDQDASVVAIHFQRGANCWRYAGSATTFNGEFAAGQRLDITSTGEADNGDGTRNWVETSEREIYLADGRSGRLLTAGADGHFAIPQSGPYQITFGPQSVVGSPGVMVICTL